MLLCCASDPVYDFSWLQSKTGTEAMTVSTDGTVFWWDTRRLGQPLEDLTLREKASTAGAIALRRDPPFTSVPL